MAEGRGNVTEITGRNVPAVRAPEAWRAGSVTQDTTAGTEHILDFLRGDN